MWGEKKRGSGHFEVREGKQERRFILRHLPSTLPATGKERSQERSRGINLPRPALQTSSTRDTIVSPPLPVENCCDTEDSGWNLCSTWVLQEKRDTFKPLNTQITETPSGFERNTPQRLGNAGVNNVYLRAQNRERRETPR